MSSSGSKLALSPESSNRSPSSNSTLRRDEITALLGVMTLAAVLRFGWAGVNSFSFDEARLSHMALQMAREGEFALLGMQSSTGVPNFPAAVWIFALVYRFTLDPLVATMFTSLVSTMAVLGAWWLARQAWGKWAGLSAALFLAASPYDVFYSRSIWSQDFLVPLAVLWAVAGLVGVSGRRNWALALHAFLAGFALQVHIAGIALALGSAWLVLRFRLWRQWKALGAGGVAAVLTAAPTVYILWRYGEGAKAELAKILQQPATFHWNGFQQLANLGLGLGWERFWLGKSWGWSEPLETALTITSWLAGIAIGIGLLITLQHAVKGTPGNSSDTASSSRKQVLTALLPAWAIAAPLFFLRSKTHVNLQYQLTGLPALALMVGATTCLSWRPAWKRGVAVVILVIALTQSIAVGKTLTFVDQELAPGGMGTPLSYPRSAVSTLQSDQKPISVHVHDDAVEYSGDAAAFEVLLWDYPHRIVDGRSVIILPDEPSHLLFTFPDLPASNVARDLNLGNTVRQLPRRIGEPPFLALTVDAVELQGMRFTEPLALGNGARLQGWRIDEDDGRLRLMTHWQIGQVVEEGHFQQFNHLYLQDDSSPSAIHDVSVSSRAWQEGDHLITWVDFAASEGELDHFDIGMYTWPDMQRSPVLNRDGDPLAPIRLEISQHADQSPLN
jgi:hypothetical protein